MAKPLKKIVMLILLVGIFAGALAYVYKTVNDNATAMSITRDKMAQIDQYWLADKRFEQVEISRGLELGMPKAASYYQAIPLKVSYRTYFALVDMRDMSVFRKVDGDDVLLGNIDIDQDGNLWVLKYDNYLKSVVVNSFSPQNERLNQIQLSDSEADLEQDTVIESKRLIVTENYIFISYYGKEYARGICLDIYDKDGKHLRNYQRIIDFTVDDDERLYYLPVAYDMSKLPEKHKQIICVTLQENGKDDTVKIVSDQFDYARIQALPQSNFLFCCGTRGIDIYRVDALGQPVYYSEDFNFTRDATLDFTQLNIVDFIVDAMGNYYLLFNEQPPGSKDMAYRVAFKREIITPYHLDPRTTMSSTITTGVSF